MPVTESIHLLHQLNYRTVVETDDRVVMEMDNRPDLVNVRGAIQGGLLATLIDIAAGILCGHHVGPDQSVTTADLNIHYLAPVIEGPARAEATIRGGEHFLVVLDEIMYPLRYGWVPLDAVLACLRERPPHVHVVLTGRGAPAELIALADTVTEMSLVKHHYQAGVPAQRGIED